MNKLARTSLLCLSFFVVGCSSQHTHPMEDTWTSDDKYHWHKCTVEGCNHIEDKTPHDFSDIITGSQGNKYRKCFTCSFYRDIGEPGPHDGPEPGPAPEPSTFKITTEYTDEQYSYQEEIRQYILNKETTCKVEDYDYDDYDDQSKPITIAWDSDLNNSGFTVKYSTHSDYSDALSITLPSDATQVDLMNLEKGETYYVTVIESYKGEDRVDETTFDTDDVGPRVLAIPGLYNIRDIGGYVVQNKIGGGETKTYRIKQNLLIRGCQMDGSNSGKDLNIPEAGKKILRDQIGIRMELDLRTEEQAGYLPATGDSVLSNETTNVTYKRIDATSGSPQYKDFLNSDTARSIIKEIIKVNEHPIYYHCQAGADRTGTLSYLIEGLLGVPEDVLLKDWETTSFSIFGLRSHTSGDFKDGFNGFVTELKKQTGSTMQEKIENWFISSNGGGLSQEQVNAFKTYMLEEVQ